MFDARGAGCVRFHLKPRSSWKMQRSVMQMYDVTHQAKLWDQYLPECVTSPELHGKATKLHSAAPESACSPHEEKRRDELPAGTRALLPDISLNRKKAKKKKTQTNELYYQMGIVSVLVVVFLAFHLVSELDNKQCSDCCEKWMLFLLQGCVTEMCCHFHYTQMLARKDSLTLVWDESCLPLTLWNPPSVLLFSPYRWKMTFIMFYILIEK